MISGKLSHVASLVHLFNTKFIEFQKKKTLVRTKLKIQYFSDEAASQSKNKHNFANLINHTYNFGVQAESNFFAASHGKGTSDGLAGSIKTGLSC